MTYPAQTLILPQHISSSGVQHKKSYFSSISLHSAFAGQDLIISTISGGDSALQILIIDTAIVAGVKRFIPHEFGHDTLSPQIQARIPQYAGQAKVIDHLKATAEAHPNFEWTAIATGYTLDTNLISRNLGFNLEWHSATIHGTGTELFTASSLKRVGQVVASVISHWDEIKNQYIYAAGVITSANEILRSAEETTGREFRVGNYDVDECVAEGRKRIERGFPDSGIFLLERSMMYDERLDASAPFKTQSSNYVLGLEPESVEDVVAKAYHDPRHHGKVGCGCAS